MALTGACDVVQADIVFVLLLAWAAWETARPTFRCWSSQLLCLSLNWMLVVNAVGGSLRGHNMRTPLTVDSNFNLTMSCVNGATFLVTVALFVAGMVSKNIHWPAPSAATFAARSMSSAQRKHQAAKAAAKRRRFSNAVAPASAVVSDDASAADVCVPQWP